MGVARHANVLRSWTVCLKCCLETSTNMLSPIVKQCWIVFGLFMTFFGHGMMMSYSSCLLPGLRAPDSTIKVDLDAASWLASGIGITMMLGFMITSILMGKFGRRWVFASNVLLLITAWLVIYFAKGFSILMAGRLIGGLAIASIYCSGCTIIAEYTAPEIRGLVLNLKTVALYCGYLYMHIIANYLNWRNVALLSITPCVISILNNLTWPESPSWLISKNRFKESEDSFYWLRGHGDKAIKEIESMIRAQKIRVQTTPAKNATSLTQKVILFSKKFKEKNFLQPVAIMFFSTILLETSGRHFFPAYAVDIFMEITNDKANSFYYILFVDIISLVSTMVCCILIKVMGRKTLLFFSGITSTVLLVTLALLLFSNSRGYALNGGPWLVPSLVGIFFVLANLGCATIPLVIYSEIFPLAHRETGAGIGGATMCGAFFAFLKAVPYMLTHLKLHGMFGIFAVGMTVSLITLYFIMPETRNRTLQEIEEYFDHGRYLDEEDRVSNESETNDLMVSRVRPAAVTF